MKRQFLSFRMRSRLFAIDIDLVREIVPYGSITPVPSAPDKLAGVMILRDKNVTVVDPAASLFGGRSVAAKSTCIILIETGEAPFGLVVDAVENVIDLDEALVESSPPGLDYLAGTAVHRGETLLLLERSLLLDAQRALSDGWRPLPPEQMAKTPAPEQA